MGRDAKLSVHDGETLAEARVHLDSEMLTVGPPFRLKLRLADLGAVAAAEEGLSFRAGKTAFRLAMPQKEAAAWAKAILNPPSLATKLGLKPGVTAATLGALPHEIAAALKPFAPVEAKRGKPTAAALVFAAVPEGVKLDGLAGLPKAMASKGAVWLIYAKGGAFNGDDLIFAARAAGLKDTKVARISETHTGLRFIAGGAHSASQAGAATKAKRGQ